MTQGLYFAFSLARSTASRAGAVTQAATSKLLLLCDALKAGGIQIQDIRGSKKIPLFLLPPFRHHTADHTRMQYSVMN